MNKTVFLVSLLSSLLFSNDFTYMDVKDVKSHDVLNIRIKAGHTEKKIAGIAYNKTCVMNYGCGKNVQLEALRNMHEDEVNAFFTGTMENWCYVKDGENLGWVNSKFLTPSKAVCK